MEIEKNVLNISIDESSDESNMLLPISNKRMDQLAWLLEGSSMCVAISNVGSQFFISANEFLKSTKTRGENEKLDHICFVMEHFSKFARNEKITSDTAEIVNAREKLIKNIFLCQMSIQTKNGIRIPPKILNDIISTKVLLLNTTPQVPKIKEIDYTSLVFGFSKRIFNTIRKIENSIVHARGNSFSEIDKEEFEAFKNFNYSDDSRDEGNILFKQVKPSKELQFSSSKEKGKEEKNQQSKYQVHAELQIMSEIIDMVENKTINPPKKIYIGISKRCCFQCRCMLEAANEILKEKGVVLEFEGAHNASFEKNWVPPVGFESIKDDIEDPNIKQKIRLEYEKRLIQNLSDKVKGGEYNQRHERSSSIHSLNILEQAIVYEVSLDKQLESLNKWKPETSKIVELLNVGKNLCKIEEFSSLFEYDFKDADPREIYYNLIFKLYGVNANQDQKKMLLNFLTDKRSAPTEEMCSFFSRVKEEENIRQEESENFKENKEKASNSLSLELQETKLDCSETSIDFLLKKNIQEISDPILQVLTMKYKEASKQGASMKALKNQFLKYFRKSEDEKLLSKKIGRSVETEEAQQEKHLEKPKPGSYI